MTNYSQRYASGDSNTAGAFYFDTITAVDYPAAKVLWGAEGAVNHCSAATPMPVTAVVTGTVTVGSHAVTNAGTFAVQVDGAALVSLQLLDDAIIADDAAFTPATTKVMMAGFEFDDTTPDSVDEGDAGAARMSANRCQYVMLRDNAGNERGLNVDASGNITVNVTGTVTVGSHAVTNAGTFAVQAAQSGTWTVQPGNTANTTAWLVTGTGGTFPVTDSGGSLTVDAPVGTPVFVRLSDGAAAITALPVTDNGGALTIDDGGSTISIDDGAGSLTVDGTVGISGTVTVGTHDVGTVTTVTTVSTVTTVTTCSTVTTLTGSGVAHDAADSGNPHKIGAKATTSLSGVTLVADADRTDARSAADGALLVRDVCLEDVVQERTTNTDGASTAFTGGLAAPGAGVRLWITSVDICNSSASFCTVDLRDGAAGSVLWTLPVPATGGVVKRFDPPLKLSANTALAFDASAATTTLTISGNGFKSKL